MPPPTTGDDGRPIVRPETRAEWRTWLARHHASTTGVWLAAFKKHTGKPRIEYDDAIGEALCFGWVDSKTKTLDDETSLMWMSPRTPRSAWSRPNKERIAKLERAGLLEEAGRGAVEAAQANGSWTALDAIEALEVPDDLARRLAHNAKARTHFEAFPPSARKAILWWIASAKRPETRAKRIEETVRLAAQNIRANQ
jgi:uncharacterized protein YdeI (YjbR/CyaY-like superfamily)